MANSGATPHWTPAAIEATARDVGTLVAARGGFPVTAREITAALAEKGYSRADVELGIAWLTKNRLLEVLSVYRSPWIEGNPDAADVAALTTWDKAGRKGPPPIAPEGSAPVLSEQPGSWGSSPWRYEAFKGTAALREWLETKTAAAADSPPPAKPGEGEGNAGGDTATKKRPRKGVGGKPRLSEEEEQRRLEILRDWVQAQSAGVVGKDFCRDKGIKLKELRVFVDWESTRRKRGTNSG